MKTAIFYLAILTIVGIIFYLTSVHQYTRTERSADTGELVPKEDCYCVGSLEVLISYTGEEVLQALTTYTCNGIEWCEAP